MRTSLETLEKRIAEHASREALLEQVLASRSWRITRPLRVAGRFLHRQWPSLRTAAGTPSTPPGVGDAPLMPDVAADRLRSLLETATCYVEYGSGGTTVTAAAMNVPAIVTTESDPIGWPPVGRKVPCSRVIDTR